MNKEGSAYTFIFATVMVVIVATVLAVAAISLKPYQDQNVMHEKMQNILKSVGIESARHEAPDLFNRCVKKRLVLNYEAEVISDEEGPIDSKNKMDGFNINVQKEYKSLDIEKRNYPLFLCETPQGRFTVIPMVGTGLWGPIWGYVALKEDMNTVYGASFDHKGETPGLGAEIKEPHFQSLFTGKTLFDEQGNLASIRVVKGGADPDDLHGVDGITGGTITSVGVDEMLFRTFKIYEPYLKSNRP